MFRQNDMETTKQTTKRKKKQHGQLSVTMTCSSTRVYTGEKFPITTSYYGYLRSSTIGLK